MLRIRKKNVGIEILTLALILGGPYRDISGIMSGLSLEARAELRENARFPRYNSGPNHGI